MIPAGREMDYLVNVHVMGETEKDAPYYSTSIADAWLAVEKLAQSGVHLDLTEFKVWRCYLMKDDALIGVSRIGYAQATTAPHAICLAALQAVGTLAESGGCR